MFPIDDSCGFPDWRGRREWTLSRAKHSEWGAEVSARRRVRGGSARPGGDRSAESPPEGQSQQ